MRRAARTDANHAEIREAFREAGCLVLDMHSAGNAAPDLLVQLNGLTMPVEVKTLTGKLSKAQKKCPLMMRIVRDKAGVEETVRTLKKWHRAIRTSEEMYEAVDKTGVWT